MPHSSRLEGQPMPCPSGLGVSACRAATRWIALPFMLLGLLGCFTSRAPVEPATDLQSPRTIDAGGPLGLERLDDPIHPRYPAAFSRDGRRIAALLYEQQRNSVWSGPIGRVVVKTWDVA